MMDIDHVFETMNRYGVRYLLIGGMNFLLRHDPVTTYDIDLWIEDTVENRSRCEAALVELQAEWGKTDDDWDSVATFSTGWLSQQAVFCLNSPSGAIDIFRNVHGLGDWATSNQFAFDGVTASGVSYRGLSDADMLRCQMALPAGVRKTGRVAKLSEVLDNDSTEEQQ